MLRKLGALFLLLSVGLSLSGFAGAPSALAEQEGNPWWLWILVFFALLAFVLFVLWWWLYSGRDEEESAPPAGHKPAPAALPEPAATQVAERAPAVSSAPAVRDDLKRVEGIGPKIAGVLQSAGITTFAQLAVTDVERLKQILAEADPNLLRLADPTTWPEQARLAARDEWGALEKLQNGLKGGRRA
jgi:predicted flap endonuclease-1-like 5' DNA nuclease